VEERRSEMSKWTDFRDWFCLKILPLAIGVIATVIAKQMAQIPGLPELVGLIQPYIQAAYEKAVVDQDFKMQAILLAILSKLFQMVLAVPGVAVLEEKDANTILVGMAKEATDEMYATNPAPFGWNWSADRPYDPALDSGA
jgi:hypothetical protein